jgi:hypothetical protein
LKGDVCGYLRKLQGTIGTCRYPRGGHEGKNLFNQIKPDGTKRVQEFKVNHRDSKVAAVSVQVAKVVEVELVH